MPYAEPLQIMSFATWLSGALGLPLPIAHLAEAVIIMFILFFPLMMLKSQPYILIITSVLSMSFLTAMGVLDFWIWALIALYLAYNIAHKWGGWF